MSNKNEEKNPFTVAKSDIAKWKKEYGEIIEVSVFLDKEKKQKVRCFLKDPYENVSVLSAISTMNDTPMERNNYVLDNLWIAGDEDFKTNTRVRLAGGIQAFSAIEVLGGEVKKH